MNRSLRTVAWLAGITIGCSAVAPDVALVKNPVPVVRDQSPVQTDSLSYGLVRRPGEYRAYVLATYRNTTSTPVYFARCGGRDTYPMFGIARTGADSLRRYFSDWAWACVGGVTNGMLAPGMSMTVRVTLGSVDQPSMQPPLRAEDMIGQFRVELSLCASRVSDSERCTPVPQAARRSNAFVVHY